MICNRSYVHIYIHKRGAVPKIKAVTQVKWETDKARTKSTLNIELRVTKAKTCSGTSCTFSCTSCTFSKLKATTVVVKANCKTKLKVTPRRKATTKTGFD